LKYTFEDNIGKKIISEAEIKAKITETGNRLTKKYSGKPLLILGILKGSLPFAADLIREIKIPVMYDFIRVKSYIGDKSGELSLIVDTTEDLSEFHIVIVEDVIDTGRTMQAVKTLINERNPLSLEIITLLDKPDCREVEFKADDALFTIGNEFVVGYGLDYNEFGRNLRDICTFIK
jgi:hypoxanthine phosphoribosyltransferase